MIGAGFSLLARSITRINQPQLDLGARAIEWMGSLHDRTRHYLLLRNGWDSNPVLLRRIYTPEFLSRLVARCRDEYEGFFPGEEAIEEEALRAEFATKLVNDLLHNEDTMSMANSVESRVPYLDLELVRFVARTPAALRFRDGQKGLLKRALRGVVPDETLRGPKWGFTVDPVEQYRKDLRSAAIRWLSPDRLRRGGVFNPQFVERLLHTRPHSRLRWHYFLLWQMIGLEMWRELFLEGNRPDLPESIGISHRLAS
jgi:asparagine synthase (glutamine-hydrolysing)